MLRLRSIVLPFVSSVHITFRVVRAHYLSGRMHLFSRQVYRLVQEISGYALEKPCHVSGE